MNNTKTKIRGCIWRKVGKKRESKIIHIEVPGKFDDTDFTHNACRKIFTEYPGWLIAGFVEDK